MKVLIVGSLCDDKWIGALLRNIKKASPSLEIHFFHIFSCNEELTKASLLCDKLYLPKRLFPDFFYLNKKIGILFSKIDVSYAVCDFLAKQRKNNVMYDVVNIHYPQNRILKYWKGFNEISKSTIITPWGSEVLRISKLEQRKMASYISHYKYVMSSDNERFRNQLKEVLCVDDSKFLDCDFGSEMIDAICDSVSITKEQAKLHFGIGNNYTIVVGYNAGQAQNHIPIIQAIESVKEQLPKDFYIVLPMTYNKSKRYIDLVKTKLIEANVNHVILEDYLSTEAMVCLRKAADMFIHGQVTDANSVSLAEHLLCNNTVINAGWLRYANRETFGIPYYLFNDFNELSQVIIKAYKNGPIVSDKLIDSISKEGWRGVTNKWLAIFENA